MDGAVAGACITVLKFFFDGDSPIQNPVVPSSDGMTLSPYAAPPGQQLTVNGGLHKLAHNISFGHGIHAGIHRRSDNDASIQLGEAVALSYLRDQARTYNPPTLNSTAADTSLAGPAPDKKPAVAPSRSCGSGARRTPSLLRTCYVSRSSWRRVRSSAGT
jgi:hypothetical protein